MFKDEFRRLRKQRNLTQSEIAEVFDVAQSTITSWELGTRNPDIETLLKISDYFCVSTDELLGKRIPEDEEKDIWEYRQAMMDDDRKALLSFAKNGKIKAVRQVNAIHDVMRATNPEFYDGDDPA